MTGQLPKVTLVVIAYNQAEVVGEAIAAALAQSYPNLDFIFSDDCSPDGTLASMRATVAGSDRRQNVTLRATARNMGLAGHINDVVMLTDAPFVVFCAGDDVAEIDKVARLVAPMLADPTVMGVHSAITTISASGTVLGRTDSIHGDGLNDLDYVIDHAASAVIQSHACRREVFTRFPPFDPELSNEGIVITAREAMLGRIVYVPEPLTRYRLGGLSTQSELTTDQRRIAEPVKITHWYYSALSQIRRDIEATGIAVPPSTRARLDRHIDYFARLLRINQRPLAIGDLLAILRDHEGGLRALRAFARRNLPSALYRWLS